MEVSCTVETFDKNLRCVDRRERRKSILSVNTVPSKAEVQLVLKSPASNDVWITKGIKVFGNAVAEQGKLSLHIPEYQQVLLISCTAGMTQHLAKLAADIRSALVAAQCSAVTLKPLQQPLQQTRKEEEPVKSVFLQCQLSPEKWHFGSTGSGFTPTTKKTRHGPTPPKLQDENRAPITYRFSTSPKKEPPAPLLLKLTDVQKQVLSACASGSNVFVTGGAGTGKSALLEMVITKLKTLYGQEAVFVCATTGLAACAIGGTTVHQFAGLQGHNDGDDKEKVVREVLSRPNAVKRWQKCRALVVDEISMMPSAMLELIDMIAQRARQKSTCFGGIKVVFTGDFFQLPPVMRKNTTTVTVNGTAAENNNFCFNSTVWERLALRSFLLDKVFRQQTDDSFVRLLNSVRWGRLDPEGLLQLNQSVGRKVGNAFGILPTQLFTHTKGVDELNMKELESLPGISKQYTATDSGDPAFLKFLDAYCTAKKAIRLKEGAQVILLKTIDAGAGLVNGARGVVVRFANEKRPCVRFMCGLERFVDNQTFAVQLGGRVIAQRSQIPLDLGWGMSVHKSQGQSLDCAVLHLKSTFEYGQAYVALSRVRTMAGMSLSAPLEARHVRAHPAVVDFYIKLEDKGKEEMK